MNQVIILGVGNILMQDEGFGVRVVEQLVGQYTFPEHVQVLDGGTLGMELLSFLTGADKLVLIDAIDGRLPPGSLYQISHEEVKAYFKDKVSMHELGIQDVLAVMEILEKPIKEVRIIGVQPLTVDTGLRMTPLILDKMGDVIEKLLLLLKEWQIEVLENDK